MLRMYSYVSAEYYCELDTTEIYPVPKVFYGSVATLEATRILKTREKYWPRVQGREN
jgi:hypothetical protein